MLIFPVAGQHEGAFYWHAHLPATFEDADQIKLRCF
jgi:hypothetical protein